MINPYAVYVYCDGAMDYKPKNLGGIGFTITFPDSIPLEPIQISIGQYNGGNIERIELEALIQAMKKTIEVFNENKELLKNINQITFITDRYGLCDLEKTNSYKIRQWRNNKWKNFEGKPIKNNELLDKLDKTRKKLSSQFYTNVNIEYKQRKKNRVADKLAKKAKKEGLKIDILSKKGEKIGKRIFQGDEIKYTKLRIKDELHINVFRKDPVQDEWEIWVEIFSGTFKGSKLKIYADDELAAKLQRGNQYNVKIKDIFIHHIHIYRTIKKIKRKPIAHNHVMA